MHRQQCKVVKRFSKPSKCQSTTDTLALPLHHVALYLTYPSILTLNSTCSGIFHLSTAPDGDYKLACSVSSREWLGLGEQWSWMMEKRVLEHTWMCSVSSTWTNDKTSTREEVLEAIFDNTTKFLKYYRDFARPEEDQLLEHCHSSHEDALIQEFLHEVGPNYSGRIPRSRSVRTEIAKWRWSHHAWTLYLRILDANGFDDEILHKAQMYMKDNPVIAAAICAILAVRYDGTIGDEIGLRQLVPLALKDSEAEPIDVLAAWPEPEDLNRSERGSGRKHLGGWNVQVIQAFARLEAKVTTLLFCHPPQGFPHPLIADDFAFSLLELFTSTVGLRDVEELRRIAKSFCHNLGNPEVARLDPMLKVIACMAVTSAEDSNYDDTNASSRPHIVDLSGSDDANANSRTLTIFFGSDANIRSNSSSNSSCGSSRKGVSSNRIKCSLSSGMSHVSGLSGDEPDLLAAIQAVNNIEKYLSVAKVGKIRLSRSNTKKGTPQSRNKKSGVPFISPPAHPAKSEPPPPSKRFWRLW